MFTFPLVLDGATGTNLISEGLEKGVCVEKWVLENEDVIKRLQKNFYENGSDICYAPTFSANSIKLKHFSLEDNVYDYNKRLVALTKSVCPKGKFVAGDMSPTGLFIEPFSDIPFTYLVDSYKEQANALNDAGVDLFGIETMMSLYDIRAAVLALQSFNKPIFVTITVNEFGKTLSGATPLSVLLTIQEMNVFAFGINCSNGPDDNMVNLVKDLVENSKIPIIVKPNAGKPDVNIPNKFDLEPKEMAKSIVPLLDAGASIIGGCCGTTPNHIKEIKKVVSSYDFKKIKKDNNANLTYLTSENSYYLFDKDNYKSCVIDCSEDMCDDIMDMCDEDIDILTININSLEDGYTFSKNAHFSTLPIMFSGDNYDFLDNALFLYQGRCAVLQNDSINAEALKCLKLKYGALIV